MALKIYNFSDSPFFEHFLQGGILGIRVLDQRNQKLTVPGLTLKTLVFTLPLKTITFALPPSGEDVFSFEEIKSQIETQEPLLLVTRLDGVLAITRKVVTVGINLNFLLSTANALLGFSDTAITLGTVYTPDGAAPRLLAVNQIGDGHFQVITDE